MSRKPTKDRARAAGPFVLTFVAGVIGTLITQAISNRYEYQNSTREHRVAALRSYATACSQTAVATARVANIGLYEVGIQNLPTSESQKLERILRLYDDAGESWRKHVADLAVQRDVVNALFDAQVNPFGAIREGWPPEFQVNPGTVDASAFMKDIQKDPLGSLRKMAPVIGNQAAQLTTYCQESSQALSRELR